MNATRVRPAAVAGAFYDDDPVRLRHFVDDALRTAASAGGDDAVVPKAVVVPHAGYVYSGPVAASAYARLRRGAGIVERVVLLGPAHRVPVRGLAVSSADAFATPLGPVPVDTEGRDVVLRFPQVGVSDDAHALEHSLEVQLPFLFEVLGPVNVLPLVVGLTTAEEVAEVIEAVWGGDETLVVVSTDLSHYHDYETATTLDRMTATAVEAGRIEAIGDRDACGAYPLRGLLLAAADHGLRTRLLDLRNSGDTAGPRDRVVGYGAFELSA